MDAAEDVLAAGRGAGLRSQARRRPCLRRRDAGRSRGVVAAAARMVGVEARIRARARASLGGTARTSRRASSPPTPRSTTSACAARHLRDASGARVPQARFGQRGGARALARTRRRLALRCTALRIGSDGSRRHSMACCSPAARASGCVPSASTPARCSRPPRSAIAWMPACGAGSCPRNRRRCCSTSKSPACTAVRCRRTARSGVGFAPVGNSPGLRGLAGDLHRRCRWLRVATAIRRRRCDFDWPRGFGVVHPSRLGGRVAVARRRGLARRHRCVARARRRLRRRRARRPVVPERRHAAVDRLRRRHRRLAAHRRQGLPGPSPDARRDRTIGSTPRWSADVCGTAARSCPAIWTTGPSAPQRPVPRRRALDDATLKFPPDWPAAEPVDGDVSFVGNGFTVEGKGALAGVGIAHFHAGIPDFSKAELYVQAQGGSDASKLLDLLQAQSVAQGARRNARQHRRQRPGRCHLRSAAAAASRPAPAAARRRHGRTPGRALREKRWDLAFDDVRGKADYGDGGFAANALRCATTASPARSRCARAASCATRRRPSRPTCRRSMEAEDLIDRAGNLGWLKPYLDGRSAWTVGVALPKAAGANAAAPTGCTLRSTLVGTTLDLPAPLRKAPMRRWPRPSKTACRWARAKCGRLRQPRRAARAHAQRPDRRARRARQRSRRRSAAGLGPDRDRPRGDAGCDRLDRHRQGRASGGGNAAAAAHRPARRSPAAARRRVPRCARAGASPANGGTAVASPAPRSPAPSTVPDAKGAAITGRFERAHWRCAGDRERAAARRPPTGPHPIDPATIPPLSFDVADLRLQRARSARRPSARARPRPACASTAAGARRSTHRRHRRLERHGRGARTRVRPQIDSEDFGAADGRRRLRRPAAGGKGTAKFDASWAGRPREFERAASKARSRST